VPQTFVTTAYAERGGSWMLPEAAAKKSILVYVAEMHRRGVFVYDYKSGKRVGALTGLHDPAGECVDAKGDVYVTEFLISRRVSWGITLRPNHGERQGAGATEKPTGPL
jgi:hypothetical protein